MLCGLCTHRDVSGGVREQKSMEEFLRVQHVWQDVLDQYPDRLLPVRSRRNWNGAFRKKRPGLLLTIEGRPASAEAILENCEESL